MLSASSTLHSSVHLVKAVGILERVPKVGGKKSKVMNSGGRLQDWFSMFLILVTHTPALTHQPGHRHYSAHGINRPVAHRQIGR